MSLDFNALKAHDHLFWPIFKYHQGTLKIEGITLNFIETGLVAFAGTIIHFKFEFTAKA